MENKIILATWNCANKNFYQNRDWYPLLKKIFDKVILFSPRYNYYLFGKQALNKRLINLVRREEPDFVILGLSKHEITQDTLSEIKKYTQTIGFFGDDQWRFEEYSKPYAKCFDYIWTTRENFEDYKKLGMTKMAFPFSISIDFFKPLNIKKKYDVTFIGGMIRDRKEYLDYLKNNGVKVKVFGDKWYRFLTSKNFVKVVNQSKINLNFSKGAKVMPPERDTQFKGRALEVLGCKSFLLTEDFIGHDLYLENKDIVFKDKEELLNKVKYYLKNEHERERLTNELHEYVIENYNLEKFFKEFFSI